MSTTRPTLIDGYFKRGSSYRFKITRLASDGITPIDLTGLTTRAMFRDGSETGTLLFTLTEGNGITVDALNGIITLYVSCLLSETLTAGNKVYFDVEQTNHLDPSYAWQSLTYYFIVVEQVTRDD